MPIYEYYCPDNHRIYQFYAKTLAQGRTIPPCPDNPRYGMTKMFSAFSVTSGGGKKADGGTSPSAAAAPEDPRMDAAMHAMEREFSSVDENDPRAMGRMMRRMTELTGEKIDGEMEEVVRKLEEGADPESLEAQLGGGAAPDGSDPEGDGPGGPPPGDPPAGRPSFRPRRGPARRDPKLYDYE